MSKKSANPIESTIRPAFATPRVYATISGMSLRAVYEELAKGNLRAVKRGASTLIDVDHGLAYMRSLPAATYRAPNQTGSNKAA